MTSSEIDSFLLEAPVVDMKLLILSLTDLLLSLQLYPSTEYCTGGSEPLVNENMILIRVSLENPPLYFKDLSQSRSVLQIIQPVPTIY